MLTVTILVEKKLKNLVAIFEKGNLALILLIKVVSLPKGGLREVRFCMEKTV
jgi:hypothetical protein